MLTGAGILGALDSRQCRETCPLSGILQSSTYLAGISGGLWLVMNNWLGENRPYGERLEELKQDLLISLLEGVPNFDVNGLRQSVDGDASSSSSQEPKTTNSPRSETRRLQPTSESNPEDGDGSKVSLLPMLVRALFSTSSKEPKSDKKPANLKRALDFYKALTVEAHAKRSAGYTVSVIDYWGRALARRVFPKKFRTPGMTVSSATKLSSFQNASQPFPIMNSIEVLPGTAKDSVCSHTMEFNPFEFGSWDSFLNAFMDIRYLGTAMDDGTPVSYGTEFNRSLCVSGYDNAGFITATSSGLFNTMFKYIYRVILALRNELSKFFDQFLKMFGFSSQQTSSNTSNSEYAIYSPNPFYGLRHGTKGRFVNTTDTLYLADGGDDGQNIPFSSLMVPDRQVDIIMAYDMASEINNFPNASSLRASERRFHAPTSELAIPIFKDDCGNWRRIFPNTPTEEEFFANKHFRRPTFLGCDFEDYPLHQKGNGSQFVVLKDYKPPVIVYAPNYNYSFASNTSTFRTTYTADEVQGMYNNGFNIATYKKNPLYSSCVACASLKRKLQDLPPICAACFRKFCYHR